MLPVQCKMARAAIGWSVRDLAKVSGTSANTVSRFETGKDSYTSTAQKLERALIESGKIEFIDQNGVVLIDG